MEHKIITSKKLHLDFGTYNSKLVLLMHVVHDTTLSTVLCIIVKWCQ